MTVMEVGKTTIMSATTSQGDCQDSEDNSHYHDEGHDKGQDDSPNKVPDVKMTQKFQTVLSLQVSWGLVLIQSLPHNKNIKSHP